MSAGAGFVVSAAPPAPAPAVVAAAATPTTAAPATAASADAAQPIDFAALLLGAVFPASAQPAAADSANESSEIMELKELPEAEPEDPQTPIDLLFALLAPPVQPLPPPKAGAASLLPDGTDTPAPSVPTDPFAGLGLASRELTSLLPQAAQLAVPTAPVPTGALPSATALPLAAAAPADRNALAITQLQLATSAPPAADMGAGAIDAFASADGAAPAPQFSLPTPATHAPRETASVPPPNPHVLVRAQPEPLADAAATTLRWQAAENIGTAEIRLAPKDLGKIDIDLRIEGKHLHVDFTSASPEVRAALEDSLPKLRETLASHGLHLAQADIGGQPRGDRPGAPAPLVPRGDVGEGDGKDAPVVVTQRIRAGLLDEYA